MLSAVEPASQARDTSKEPPPDPGKPEGQPGAPTDERDRKIRCPKCRWRPKKSDIWFCMCGHGWNTFDTGGCCPNCLFRWPVTQCLKCQEYSPHEDWYGE